MSADSLATLEFKPDFAEAQKRWAAFWAGELLDRPLCCIRAPKEGAEQVWGPPYLAGADGNYQPIIDQAIAAAACTYWAGEAMPVYVPSFGPDQIAAFMGAELRLAPGNTGTNWVEAFVDDWDAVMPLTIREDNIWWMRMQEFMRLLGEAMDGKMLVSHIDMHSNADALAAIRYPSKLCMDLVDMPEKMDEAMRQVRALFPYIYDRLYEAARMDRYGTTGWVTAYHNGKTNTIQCDFAALIGPKHFDRFVLPALEEEANYLDHCAYHYDGPEALCHLASVCSIEKIDIIQWVPGAAHEPFIDWMDLLKDIQSRGKKVVVYDTIERIPIYHKELKPDLVYYDTWASSEKAADEMLQWLVDNT
jgi:5-methyltetrahydrofolate--homocysteine methyltransferase